MGKIRVKTHWDSKKFLTAVGGGWVVKDETRFYMRDMFGPEERVRANKTRGKKGKQIL